MLERIYFLAANACQREALALLVCLLSFVFAASKSVDAQNIVFDSAASNGHFYPADAMPTLSWTHTVTNKTDRILIVGVSTTTNLMVGPPAARVSSVTYGTRALSSLGSAVVSSDTRSAVEMFQLVAPPQGPDTITVSFIPLTETYAVGGSVSFTGVNQTTPDRSFASSTGLDAMPAVFISSSATDVVVDTVATLPAGYLNPSQTLLWPDRLNPFFNGAFDVGAGSTKPGATTMSWSIDTGSQAWAMAAVSLISSPNPTAAPSLISGRVTAVDGKPLGGVTVALSGAKTDRTITDSNGAYSFGAVDTGGLYTVCPARANFTFTPPQRAFSLMADNTDAVFTAEPTVETANPLDTSPEFFVRQQYLDFLGREPDQGGLEYWSDQLRQCGADVQCINARRNDISAAFFAAEEFQQTGSFIYRLYLGALGRPLSYQEFNVDRGKVIGGASLNQERAVFAEEFVRRAEFSAKYTSKTTAETFVDALLETMLQSAGVDLTSEREALIAQYHSGRDMIEGRSFVIRSAIDNARFEQRVYTKGFVLMQYFGYLQRDPDQTGYDFWLNVLNTEPDNYRGMVCAFITSAEYQLRFSSVIFHTDTACR